MLSIKISVSGHFNRDLNVDFDYIVQDSINRDSVEMRQQLLMYNTNCRSQSTKVNSEGLTKVDFSEVHKKTGIERPRSKLNVREQQSLQATEKKEQAYSDGCERELVLPDYFETSLGVVELKTKLEPFVVVEGGVSPLLVAVGVLVFGLFALCAGYFLFQRTHKKEEEDDYFEDTQSMKDTGEAFEEEIRKYEEEMSSRKGILKSSRKDTSKEGEKIRKMICLDDSTIPTITSEYSSSRKQRRHSAGMKGNTGPRASDQKSRGHLYEPQDVQSFGGSSASYASRAAVPRVISMGPDEDSASASDSRLSRELFKLTVGASSSRNIYSGSSQRSVGRRNGLDDISEVYESSNSRNAVPKIFSTDYEEQSSQDTRSSEASSAFSRNYVSSNSRNAVPKICNTDYEHSVQDTRSSASSSASSSS